MRIDSLLPVCMERFMGAVICFGWGVISGELRDLRKADGENENVMVCGLEEF